MRQGSIVHLLAGMLFLLASIFFSFLLVVVVAFEFQLVSQRLHRFLFSSDVALLALHPPAFSFFWGGGDRCSPDLWRFACWARVVHRHGVTIARTPQRIPEEPGQLTAPHFALELSLLSSLLSCLSPLTSCVIACRCTCQVHVHSITRKRRSLPSTLPRECR